MSGVEVVRSLREMGLMTFVVGCTGNALREDQEEYLGAGAHELLPKPIHQSSIEGMLAEARRRRDQEREEQRLVLELAVEHDRNEDSNPARGRTGTRE